MNQELQAIMQANNAAGLAVSENEEGLDETAHDNAVGLSEAYVKAHPEEFAGYEQVSLEDCVKAIDIYRAAWGGDWEEGDPDETRQGLFESALTDHVKMQAWIFYRFERQNIGGSYSPALRNFTLGSN